MALRLGLETPTCIYKSVYFEEKLQVYSCLLLYFVPAERFYHSVHNSQRPVSGLTGSSNGISRCPFRAAIQSQPQHTSAAPDSKTTTVQAKTCPIEKCEYNEEHCRVKRATEDGRCECAAQGLQPIGQPLSHRGLFCQHA